jgi:hypothetical protein
VGPGRDPGRATAESSKLVDLFALDGDASRRSLDNDKTRARERNRAHFQAPAIPCRTQAVTLASSGAKMLLPAPFAIIP